MKQWVIWLILAAAVTACGPMAPSSGHWDRPGGVDQAALTRDQNECRSQAEQATDSKMPATKGAPEDAEAKRAAISNCMVAKGWVWKEREVRRTPMRSYGY